MKKMKRLVALGAAAVLATGMLAGCGGSSNTETKAAGGDAAGGGGAAGGGDAAGATRQAA